MTNWPAWRRRSRLPVPVAWGLLNSQALSMWDEQRWQHEAVWHQPLGATYHAWSVAVAAVRGRVVRASSVVENINSRWRGYFFLRREWGAD